MNRGSRRMKATLKQANPVNRKTKSDGSVTLRGTPNSDKARIGFGKRAENTGRSRAGPNDVSALISVVTTTSALRTSGSSSKTRGGSSQAPRKRPGSAYLKAPSSIASGLNENNGVSGARSRDPLTGVHRTVSTVSSWVRFTLALRPPARSPRLESAWSEESSHKNRLPRVIIVSEGVRK